ncbi:MAG: 2-dehydropantoate 2-reductase [Chloroflexi bacterium]|nr:2-dehydropantoate 2-reductase [Chloroflexota bacterium]
MRIAVMGAGSIGGYFGGMLARAGNQVTLIARGDHLAAISQRGLKVVRDEEEFTVHCDATDSPLQVGAVDLVLLTVKSYQNQQAIPAMKPLVGPNTTVLCLQNGIDTYQDAVAAFGKERVLPGAAYIEAGMQGPGVVTQTGSVVRIAFGEQDGSISERGAAISDLLESSGIPAQLERDIQKTLWTKFLFIATLAGVTTLSREEMAQLMPRPEWRAVIMGCLEEIERVGRASGVNLDPNVLQETIEYMESSIDAMHASMHSDILSGRPLELEALNGAVVRAGKDANVPTPINDVIYAMLKPYLLGRFDKLPSSQ